MANSYTSNTKLAKPAVGDSGWSTPINGNADVIDALAPVGGLCVTAKEKPSSTLNVAVSAGSYVAQDGTVTAYGGTTSQAITASTTKVLYLDLTAAGALTVAASYPTTPHVRLATVVAGTSAITSVTDNRQCFNVVGSWADGANITLGTTTGTKIGTAAAQKIAFWNATPIVQPSGAAQAALTDSTGGTAGTTLSAVGATNSGDVSATINSNFASIANLLGAIRTALVNEGLIKGSA